MPAPIQDNATMTYNEKTFHRKFEESFGYLNAEDFPPIDYSKRDQIEMLFPSYKREQLAASARREKMTKLIEIEGFDLKTPDMSADLFVNARLYIEPHKRCALFGINGAGKTCLFEAISSGSVRGFPKTMNMHHMKELEHNEKADAVSVIDTVMTSHSFLRVLWPIQQILKTQIEEANVSEEGSERHEALKENLGFVQKQLTILQSETSTKRASEMLRVLGFDEVGFKAPLSSLSGGLRMRVALASSFFADPELLLLDEPTNHLDMPSVLWLENKLRGYKGSYLLVTHDRTLLENVVTSVMLIQDLGLEYFAMGFKKFEQEKDKRDAERLKMINKFLDKNGNIDAADPRFRLKLQYQQWKNLRRERMVMLQSKFTFKAPKPLPCEANTNQEDISLIKVDNVRFSYGPERDLPFIFDIPISYEVKVSTRVGVMGPNGAGKSTLLKLITGKILPTEGTITTNPDFTLAYFGQHSTKELSLEMTPFEFMCASFPKANTGLLKGHLEKTSIMSGAQNTRMIGLSFSQRSCVIFAKLTFVPPHLLILDEPTNFLDLDSVDSLIKAVNKFSGGLITVTHNRDFLKRCSKNYLSIIPGAFLEFETMKEAERATYSFITAMEEGRQIDAKKAIAQNRGGGAQHTEESLAEAASRLSLQQQAAQEKADLAAKEKARVEKLAQEKEERRAAKRAAQRTDWAVGETCWAPIKGKFQFVTVVRNVPAMGVTVALATGKNVMVEAKKLRAENPEAGANAAAGGGGGDSRPNGNANSGRGGGGQGRGGGRGGPRGRGRGARGGSRGGGSRGSGGGRR